MKRRYGFLAALALAALLAFGIQPLFAQSGSSWYVQYFNNPNWTGSPIVTTYSPYVDFNWGTVAPAPGMPNVNWTALMSTSAYFNAGNYSFYALADDEIAVQIDGITYINTIGAGMSGKPVSVIVGLTAGNHSLVVQYRQYTGTAYAYLNWAYVVPGYPPAYPPLPVPPPVPVQPIAPTPGATPTPTCNPSYSCTCPVQATSVTTEYGNYTPCIQQNLQQAACFQSNGAWNAPNMGSIESEPKIEVWGNCTPGTTQVMQLQCGQPPVTATCSKTGAGWFYFGPA